MAIVWVWLAMSLVGLAAASRLLFRAWGRWRKERLRPERHPVRVLATLRLRQLVLWTVAFCLCLAVGVAVELAALLPFALPPGISVAVIIWLLATAMLHLLLDEIDDRRMTRRPGGATQ